MPGSAPRAAGLPGLILPALAAGTSALSEWPLAVSLSEAEELERAAPDFAHAVRRHRLLDAITRAAAAGRRTPTGL